MPQKLSAENKRIARWQQIVAAYQRQHRLWVMTHMPSMSPEHWKLYENWVGGFGALCLNQGDRNLRKMRRRLRAAREGVTATAMVALRGSHPSQVIPGLRSPQLLMNQHKKMRWAMEESYDVGKERFTVLAHEAGAAKKGRATRRK